MLITVSNPTTKLKIYPAVNNCFSFSFNLTVFERSCQLEKSFT